MEHHGVVRTNNGNILIDEEDYSRVITYGYNITINADGYTWVNCTRGVYANLSLARLLIGCPDKMYVDHINGNALDNRKENLRVVTAQQNAFNRKGKANGLPKGVKRTKYYRYEARICINSSYYYLGSYNTAEEAGEAYKKAAADWQKDHAVHTSRPLP